MKKILLLLAALALSLTAGAQVFNHLSLGAGTGLDGTSFEIASPLGSHVQVRLGYGMAFGLGYTEKNAVSIPEDPTVENSPDVYLPMKLSLARNDARLLFNIYPSKRATFHFTVGAYLGSGSFFKGVIKDIPDIYESVGLDVGDETVKVVNHQMTAELRGFGIGSPSFAVLPYAGLGFGRPVREDKRVTFSFDLGAAYQGLPSLWAQSVRSDGSRGYVDISKNELVDVTDSINEYGKYLKFWPVIDFHLYVRLF